MTNGKPSVGIIGTGTIGRAILEDLHASGRAKVAYIAVSGRNGADGVSHPTRVFSDLDEALAHPVDLLIEAATPAVLARIAPRALQSGDLCAFSCTALADPALEQAIAAECRASATRLHVPHGAILALDGLADGRDVIEKVVVTTSKSGKSLGAAEEADGLLFEGATREVCKRFPRNVNVHAAIALAGIGFDRTVSRVIAVPGQETMEHRLEVEGAGFSWDIRVASRSLGGVSGAYTPRSAVGSIRRILSAAGISIA